MTQYYYLYLQFTINNQPILLNTITDDSQAICMIKADNYLARYNIPIKTREKIILERTVWKSEYLGTLNIPLKWIDKE